MRNYGEELAYWYFRLNGFIPMTDFVLHGDEVHGTSDCDLLAVRFPHAYEEIGGHDFDWDTDLLNALGGDGTKTLAVLVQVKTGQHDASQVENIAEYFTRHLPALVKRLGFWHHESIDKLLADFEIRPSISYKKVVLNKMVILPGDRNRRNPSPWIEWKLQDVVHFLMRRMETYTEKMRDRVFFSSTIIQLLSHQAIDQDLRWRLASDVTEQE